jgi:hypothetical protein
MTFITSQNVATPIAESYFSHIQVYEAKSGSPSVSAASLSVEPVVRLGSVPALVMTPEMLNVVLRTAVLHMPLNRFEQMLRSRPIPASSGRRREAATLAPGTGADLSGGPPAKSPAGASPVVPTGTPAAVRVQAPVQDEVLSQLMALDPIFHKSKSRNLFS